MRDFIKGLRVQSRVIHALIMREIITRYGRRNLGFLWLFLEPAIFTLGVTVLWSTVRVGHGQRDFPITALVLTGYTASLAWRYGAGRTLAAVNANLALLYHPVVTVLDLLLSRILLEIIGVTGAFVFLVFLFSSAGLMELPVNYWYVIVGWSLQIWFSAGLSLLVGALGTVYETVERIWHVTSYILFILSGTFFLVEWLPPELREYALYMPTVNNIELLRYGFVGDIMTPYYNIHYSAMFNLYLTLAGCLAYKWIEKKIEIE